tara:strand:- start:608 stop:838 length:231 start_codon:yes stop_codon:yes gene_type:complete
MQKYQILEHKKSYSMWIVSNYENDLYSIYKIIKDNKGNNYIDYNNNMIINEISLKKHFKWIISGFSKNIIESITTK